MRYFGTAQWPRSYTEKAESGLIRFLQMKAAIISIFILTKNPITVWEK